MILLEDFDRDEAREVSGFEPPFGPGFEKDLCAKVSRLEIWISEDDEPEAYTEFRAYDEKGLSFAIRKVIKIKDGG